MAKVMNQIDYACKVNERVFFKNLKDEKFECVILKWNDNIATVRLDDGSEKTIEC